MDILLGLIGLAGGLLCAAADILLDLKGTDNKKIGRSGIMDSNWVKMAYWRFPASIVLAAAGVPMYYMGLYAMKNQLQGSGPLLANLFWLSSTIGALGGLFIHATVCYFPMLYKKLHEKNQALAAEEIIEDIFQGIKIPFIVMFLLLTVVPSVIIIIAALRGVLDIPYVFLVLNPLGLTLIGVTLRKISPKYFFDLPGICMPSLGLGMIGLAAALSAAGIM